QLLNPAVRSHAIPGRAGITTLRVPPGKGELITKKIQEGARLPLVELSIQHKVQRHETLQSIAADYHVSAPRLARANGIGRKHPLRLGMRLTVPASLVASTPALADSTDPRWSTSYVPEHKIRTPAQISGQ